MSRQVQGDELSEVEKVELERLRERRGFEMFAQEEAMDELREKRMSEGGLTLS